MMLGRRKFLGASAAMSYGLAPWVLGACQAQSVIRNPHDINLGDPQDNVYAIIKILGDVSGAPTTWWSDGHIFGSQEGEMIRPLMKYQSVKKGRFIKQDNGDYKYLYQGITLYLDYETEDLLDSFTNPYTNERVKVRHYKTSIGEYSYSKEGMKPSAKFKGRVNKDKAPKKPYLLEWNRVGDIISTMLDERVEYQRPSDGVWRRDNAILRYQSYWSELINGDVSAARARLNLQAQTDWFTWLNMNDQPGAIIQGGEGYKFNSLEDVPGRVLALAEQPFPGLLQKPIG